MAWKEHSYLGFWEGDKVAYRPYIPITISNGSGNEITVDALVDSGADAFVVNADIGRALGINLELCPRTYMGGSTGTKECYVCDIEYVVDGFPKQIIKTNAYFIPDLPVTALVGQNDFFEKFLIQFDKSNNTFKLRKK